MTTDAYETGVPAVDALLAGAVDVATATEFVMVRKSFDNDNLRTFAQIANTHPIGLVARKDRGMEKLSDLAQWMIRNNLTRVRNPPPPRLKGGY